MRTEYFELSASGKREKRQREESPKNEPKLAV